jgi:hypothetical protein
MIKTIRSLLSPAMIVACAALVIALGGVSYAATVLPKDSVGSAQLRKGSVSHAKLHRNAVTGTQVKDGTLTAADFKAGQLRAGAAGPQGPQGPKGDAGPAGPPGAAATKLFAAVRVDGSIAHGSGVTAVTETGTGSYTVTFERSLADCVATASYYNESPNSAWSNANHFALTRVANHPDQLTVFIWNTGFNQAFSVPFSIIAVC